MNGSIVPQIGVMFPSKTIISSTFTTLKFDDLDGYMNYEYGDNNQYSGKSYSFDAFAARFRTSGYDNVLDEVLTTKNGKKIMLTTKSYNDSSLATPKFEKLLTFFYPFVTAEGEYRAYKIEFTVTTEDTDVYQVRQLIESLEFPGKSPFTE